MCLTFHRIKGTEKKQNAGKRVVFAPCGGCEECLKKAQYAWAWRLTAEFQKSITEGWGVGFLTLTYDDETLPRCELLDNLACFDKLSVRNYIDNVRKHLHKKYGVKSLKYFVACEYGPDTRRPHMHMLVSWPKSVLTAEEMHAILAHYWREPLYKMCGKKKVFVRNGYGFVCPRDPQGGVSKKTGKEYKPFEVASSVDALNAAFYCAKYVTKDYTFMSEVKKRLYPAGGAFNFSSVYKDSLHAIKNALPFHIQSKSLGFSLVAEMSDKERLDLITNGRAFFGNDRLLMPPLYIQNKILFAPDYVYELLPNQEPKRLVKRQLTDFHKKYLKTILGMKERYFDLVFMQFENLDYWVKSGFPCDKAEEIVWFVQHNSLKLGCKLSVAYIYYFGMKYEYCFEDRYVTYINRFKHPRVVNFCSCNSDYVSYVSESEAEKKVEYIVRALPSVVSFEELAYLLSVAENIRIMYLFNDALSKRDLSTAPRTYSSILIDVQMYNNIQEFFTYLYSFFKFKYTGVKDEKIDYWRDYYHND